MELGHSSVDPVLGTVESIIAVGVLIALSGFFAGSETALTAVSKARMHTLAKEGNKRAKLVNKIREKKDDMIGALMLGNTAVHVAASAIMAGLLIRLFGEAGVFYASLVMTALVVIFGEVLPKSYALQYADNVAMRIAPLIRGCIFVFSPVTAMITWIVRMTLKIIGVDQGKGSGRSHIEVLRGAIELHHGKSEETQEQRVMLRSILDLFDVIVGDVMTHRRNVLMINGDQPMKNIIQDALESPYTRIPVWRDNQDNIIGLLHLKLLFKALNLAGGDPSQLKLEDVVLEPWFIPETTSLHDQLQAFQERREHFAMVVDEYGAFEGIVTLEDIIEEIVGEIDDEHNLSVSGVRKVQGGKYLIDGSVTIRDLKREFEWELPDEDYSTIAGLLLYETRAIPEVGQSFIFYGFQFDVMRRHRNQITLVRVTPPSKKGSAKSSARSPAAALG